MWSAMCVCFRSAFLNHGFLRSTRTHMTPAPPHDCSTSRQFIQNSSVGTNGDNSGLGQ